MLGKFQLQKRLEPKCPETSMRSRSAALAIASVLLAVCLAAPGATAQAPKKTGSKASAAAAKPAWRFVRRVSGPALEYGTGSEQIQLALSCQPDTGLLRIVAQIGSRGLRPGDGAAIRLANGKSRFEIAGTAFSTEFRKEVDIGGATRFDSALLLLFKGDTLVLEVPGRKRSLPISNAGPSTEAFRKACTATASTAPAPAG
jgi:hypothetical protein